MINRKHPILEIYSLPLVCILIVLGLLGVGLWPFQPFPPNEVAWLSASPGLEFGGRGVVASSGLIAAATGNEPSSCSLRIRLQPRIVRLHGATTLLGFYTPHNPMQFRLMQYRDEILIRKDHRDSQNRLKTVEIELERAFVRAEPITFTITSGPHGSVAYRNGVRAGESTRLGLTCADFSGQLVLGNSPVGDNAWQGRILDLAIYNRELSAAEIARDANSDHGALDRAAADGKDEERKTSTDKSVVAHYAFLESSGNVIHSSEGSASDLRIPDVFRILHKLFLMPPWEETADKVALRDISINIVGFMPFGFFYFAYLRRSREPRQTAILVIAAGAAVSLTIEILQYFVPSRSSDMIDFVTNTVGTGLGVLLFMWQPIHARATKLRILRGPLEQARRR